MCPSKGRGAGEEEEGNGAPVVGSNAWKCPYSTFTDHDVQGIPELTPSPLNASAGHHRRKPGIRALLLKRMLLWDQHSHWLSHSRSQCRQLLPTCRQKGCFVGCACMVSRAGVTPGHNYICLYYFKKQGEVGENFKILKQGLGWSVNSQNLFLFSLFLWIIS